MADTEPWVALYMSLIHLTTLLFLPTAYDDGPLFGSIDIATGCRVTPRTTCVSSRIIEIVSVAQETEVPDEFAHKIIKTPEICQDSSTVDCPQHMDFFRLWINVLFRLQRSVLNLWKQCFFQPSEGSSSLWRRSAHSLEDCLSLWIIKTPVPTGSTWMKKAFRGFIGGG